MKIFALFALFAAASAQTTQERIGPVDGDGTPGGGNGQPTLDPNDPALSGEQAVSQADCDVDNCIICLEANLCQSCDDGYSTNHTSGDGSCKECTQQDCRVCDNGINTCSGCYEGFVIDADGACAACQIEGCGECDQGIDTCSTCAQGYFQDDEGTCSSCFENCAECASVDSNGNVGGCLQCDEDYEAEIDGSCGQIGTDCGSNCQDCEEHNQCKTCDDGYSVQLFNNGLSSGCQPCPDNCNSCADGETCDECKDGFVLDDISGTCATTEQIYANVCDCRDQDSNSGCTCPGDEGDSKDGCCDAGGMCGGTDGVCFTYSNDACVDYDNCAYCFGQSFCGACDEGYYKQEGRAWGDCIAMPTNWDTSLCDLAHLYNDQCDCGCGGEDPECAEHKVINCDGDSVYCDASGECAECSLDGCAFCTNGDSNDECIECASGYDLDTSDNTCIQCEIDGCDSCAVGVSFNTETGQVETGTTCRTCMDGYWQSLADNTCTACDDANCDQCSESGCQQCADGFSLDTTDSTCSSCGDNCLQCGASQCNRCATNYEVVNGDCALASEDCGDNCETCSRGGQCKICSAGFYVGAGTNGKCVGCMDNCDSCRDANSCSTCSDGYDYDIDEFACLAAGECLADVCDCRESDNNGCNCEADEETSKAGCCNKDCGLCSDLCADYDADVQCTDFSNCNYCYGQTYCMECDEDYYQPEYQGDCVALPDGWTCDVNLLGNNECDCDCGGYDPDCDDWPADGCESGEYCSTEGTCDTCVLAGCMHCSNGDGHLDGTCMECTDGHYQDDNGDCISCDLTGCAVCLLAAGSGDQEDEYSCKECSEGYYMTNSDLCASCDIDNCDVCSADGSCEECTSGFSLEDGSCASCPADCLDCTGDITSCKRCDDGFEVVESDGSCGETGNDCGDNCLVCGAQGTCKQCMNGFYKDSDGYCQACMDNCGTCSGVDTCSECDQGYGYVDASGVCEAYSDALEYCAAQIRDGVLSEGAECECTGWECAEKVEDPVSLRRH